MRLRVNLKGVCKEFDSYGEYNLGVDAFPDNLSMVSNSSNASVDFEDLLEVCYSIIQIIFVSQLRCFLRKDFYF